MVVRVGETTGFEEVDVKPEGMLVHEYVFPLYGVSPSKTAAPAHMVEFDPAEATGNEMVSECVVVQPVAVIVSVSVNVVFAVGLNDGFEEVDVNPDGVLVHA